MLTENDIVESVSQFLKSKNYDIIQSLKTNEQGIDIIAKEGNELLFIEAKGETSSVKTSKRYGLPFTRNQIRNHISVAIFACMKVITKNQGQQNVKVGIALPDTKIQREILNSVLPALKSMKILIYWVGESEVIVE